MQGGNALFFYIIISKENDMTDEQRLLVEAKLFDAMRAFHDLDDKENRFSQMLLKIGGLLKVG